MSCFFFFKLIDNIELNGSPVENNFGLNSVDFDLNCRIVVVVVVAVLDNYSWMHILELHSPDNILARRLGNILPAQKENMKSTLIRNGSLEMVQHHQR